MHNSHYLGSVIAPDQNAEFNMVANTIEEAEDCFVDAKERLLDVNNWNRYNPMQGIAFHLTDGHGRSVNRKAHRGDHIRIDFPGMEGAHTCAVIEAIEYDDYPDLSMETFTLRMRPCAHSADTDDADETMLEGSMIIERREKQVFTAFQTRKVPELQGTEDGFCGLYEAQWNSMTNKFAA